MMKVHHENPLVYCPVPDDVDFGIIMNDNSMMNAFLFEGDVAYLKAGDEFKNGDIAAVELPGGSWMIRRVYVSEDGKKLTLCPANPYYPDLEFVGDDKVKVCAKVIYSIHRHDDESFRPVVRN